MLTITACGDPYVYSGPQFNVSFIGHGVASYLDHRPDLFSDLGSILLAVVDFPFSLTLDTALLPVTIPLQIDDCKFADHK